MVQTVKNLLAVQETRIRSLGWEDPLEKDIAAHSSILAWKIPTWHFHSELIPLVHQEGDAWPGLEHISGTRPAGGRPGESVISTHMATLTSPHCKSKSFFLLEFTHFKY